jgi:PAS domain S-box-containing protein
MILALPTPDEERRIAALRQYAVLDTRPDHVLDDITSLAAAICGAPIAAISLVDEHRQWFKSKVGLDMEQSARDISFCGHAVQQRDLFVVADTKLDGRFADNPFVIGDLNVCFYAGAPLVNPEDEALGVLCVIDHVPRVLTDLQKQALRVLSRQVVAHLELRRKTRASVESEEKLRMLAENITDVFWITSPDFQKIEYVSPGYELIWGRSMVSLYADPDQWTDAILPGDRKRVLGVLATLEESTPSVSVEYQITRPNGTIRWVHDRRFQVRDAAGTLVQLTGITADITERKRAEEVLLGVASRTSRLQRWRIFRDLGAIFLLSGLVFATCNQLRLSDKSFQFVAAHDESAGTVLDEVLLTLVFFCLAMLVFAYRRWMESKADILSQTQVSNALSVLHVEMEAQVRQRTVELARTNEDLRKEIVERQRAKALIEQFPAIIESTDDAIVSKTLDGIITTWNPAAERMFGYAAPEIIGKPITLLFPADRLEEEREILACIARGERVRHFETVRVRKDGSHVQVSATISPIVNANEKITGISKIIRDVSNYKLAEDRLKKERDFVSAVVDTVGSLVVVLDRQAHIIRFNRACERLTGYSSAEVVGLNLLELLIMPEEQSSTRDEFGNLCAGQFPNTFDNHWLDKHGKPRAITWSNTALVDANGAVEYVIGTGTDITERKHAQELIAEQAALLDKARDAIVTADLESRIQFWNKGAEHLYGWSKEEALGKKITELIAVNPEMINDIIPVLLEKGEFSNEVEHLTKDGRRLTVEARRTLIRNDDGNPQSLFAIYTDITEKKKIEAQFMRAQRMESIGTLAGGVAHDLNNILAPIMMSIDILKDMSTEPHAVEILETIEVSAKRGADIVRQVLSFARGLEGQRIEVQPKHLIKDLENIIKDTFPKDIRLKFTMPDDIWTILGDPTQVHQILLNLCVNARDAMPNGGTLIVSAENSVIDDQYAAMNIQAKAGRYVIISVTDSGTGIPQSIRDKIFEPFFTTKELSKGTGLGLSTVMAIVKSHEGVVNVYSEAGKGTTFNVYLPATDIPSDAYNHPAKVESLPRGNGEMILVVDDEASILYITSQTLQAFGYRVMTAANGAAAVASYVKHQAEIAVVLTDMMMPIMDGTATIYALSQINPMIKIVAASGLNANGADSKLAGAQFKYFLTKPYTAETLLKTIRVILDEP